MFERDKGEHEVQMADGKMLAELKRVGIDVIDNYFIDELSHITHKLRPPLRTNRMKCWWFISCHSKLSFRISCSFFQGLQNFCQLTKKS